MEKPKFNFGDMVIPTEQAYKNGVFKWQQEGTILGVVVWSDDQYVGVHQKGRKASSTYSPIFWVKA